jgi:hypothetical protein
MSVKREDEVKSAVMEAIHEMGLSPKYKKPIRQNIRHSKIAVSKKLMVFASIIYALTWMAYIFAWYHEGLEPPVGLKQMVTWLYGASLALYNGKSLIENKAKIEHGENIE